MRIGRTLPPAAAPIGLQALAAGIAGLLRGNETLDRFRRELKEHLGVRHCFLVSSGKAALTLVLLALKDLSPERDEVIIPAFTCYSVPSSILRAGLRVRLCDLGQGSLDFDPASLTGMLTDDAMRKTLAIVPTHLYGYAADVAGIRALATDMKVAVVEDAAQAMGESQGDRKLGTLGDVGFFSLGRGKAFSTVEGGVIVTNRDDIAAALNARIASLPGYGSGALLKLMGKAGALTTFTRPLLFWIPRALSFLRLGETLFDMTFPVAGMSSFQAGLALSWMARLDAMRRVRRENSQRWVQVLGEIGVHVPWIQPAQTPGLLRFPIPVASADRRRWLLLESARKGTGLATAYPEPINRLPQLRNEIRYQDCPVAEGHAHQLVTLPTHGYLRDSDFLLIGQSLRRAFSASVQCGVTPS